MTDPRRIAHRPGSPRAAGLLLLGVSFAAGEGAPAAVGEPVPDLEFTRLAGHDGRTRLSELFGRPVVLAGWRRHIGEGLHAAYLADELYHQFEKDGLVVVLLDREPWEGEPPWVVDVDFWYRFFGTPLWITESVAGENDPALVRAESALDVRSLVVIGVDGRLLVETRVDADDEEAYEDLRKELEQVLRDELSKTKKGWGEDPVAKKARKLAFGKGDLSGALDALDGVREDARLPAHDGVRSEIARHVDAQRKSVEFLLAEGRYGDAREALSGLTGALRGREELAAALEPLTERLESDSGKALLKEDRKLERILAPYFERDLDDLDLDLLRDLRAFAEEHGDSPVAERARRLDPLLKRIVRILRRIPEEELEERIRND